MADLAYHFHESGLWAKAASYSGRAGEKALAFYAPRTAVEHFSRALGARRVLGLLPPAALLRARGRAYEVLGEFDAACADYSAAQEAAHVANDDIAEWQSLLALGFLWLERDYQHGGEYFQQSLGLARRLNRPELIARSLNRVGNWLTNAEQPHAGLRYHQEALEIFEALSDPRGKAETLDLFSAARLMGGDVLGGVRDAGQAIALMRELDDRRGVAGALGICAMRGGSYLIDTTVSTAESMDQCIGDSEEALSLARQIGWRSGEAATLNILAAILGHFGYFDRGLRTAEQGLVIATEIGHGGWIATAHYALGVTCLHMLALPRAIDHLERSLLAANETRSLYLQRMIAGYLASTHVANGQLAKASGILSEILPAIVKPLTQAERIVLCASAELALAQGEPEKALSVLDSMVAHAANLGTASGQAGAVIPRLWYLRGSALFALKRPREALAVLLPAEKYAGLKGVRPIRWQTLATLGHVYLALGKRVDAADALSGARAVVADLAAGISAEQVRSSFSRRAHVRIGRSPAVSALSRAKQQFGGLTERERQIAVLIAQGKSNREIAATLVLSHRTVEVHIANIMTKLKFEARTQIAAWAVAQRLVPDKDG